MYYLAIQLFKLLLEGMIVKDLDRLRDIQIISSHKKALNIEFAITDEVIIHIGGNDILKGIH